MHSVGVVYTSFTLGEEPDGDASRDHLVGGRELDHSNVIFNVMVVIS